jgi:hypothetical protein
VPTAGKHSENLTAIVTSGKGRYAEAKGDGTWETYQTQSATLPGETLGYSDNDGQHQKVIPRGGAASWEIARNAAPGRSYVSYSFFGSFNAVARPAQRTTALQCRAWSGLPLDAVPDFFETCPERRFWPAI